MFSDEVWAFGGAFTQSYVTILVEGHPDNILRDRYNPLNYTHKYSKRHAWMFHSTIYNGKKGLAQFWDKEWGTMNSERYDYFILSRIGDFFEEERLHNR